MNAVEFDVRASSPGIYALTPRLGSHQTFHLREQWLPKAMQYITEHGNHSLSEKDVHHELGIGKNMLDSLKFWMEVSGFFRSEIQTGSRVKTFHLNTLGSIALSQDPYIEDRASLWLIHIGLCSQIGAAAWYWFFNELRFTDGPDQHLELQLETWLQEQSPEKIWSRKSIEREIKCLLSTYSPPKLSNDIVSLEVLSPLTSLGLISRQTARLERIYRPETDLPLNIFLYALAKFCAHSDLLDHSFDDLLWQPLSPGRIFGLNSEGLEYFLKLADTTDIQITKNQGVGLRRAHLLRPEADNFLKRHYIDG